MNETTGQKAEEAKLPHKRILFGVGLAILGLWLGSYFFIQWWQVADLAHSGQVGDTFGAVNALFSGLAFAGVIYAILLQKQELQLQRRELEETRTELARSARAQEESQKALVAQVDELREQRYAGFQPWVLPMLEVDQDTPVDAHGLGFHNYGNGAAIDLRLFINDGTAIQTVNEWQQRTRLSGVEMYGPRWSVLRAGQGNSWRGVIESQTDGTEGLVLVEYRDIYGREFLSGWEYRVNKRHGAEFVLIKGSPIYPVGRTKNIPTSRV